MRDLNFALSVMCRHNKDGSFGTRKARHDNLQLIARELKELGFNQIKHPSQFKAKHVYSLLEKWQDPVKPLSIGTIKNRLGSLRWAGEKSGNTGFIRSSNDYYGIERRSFVGEDKALEFTHEKLAAITDDRVRFSAELQKHFGLRREEAIKFVVSYADRTTHIHLKSSWCKGGRERDIPVVTKEQTQLLKRIRAAVGVGSLIPERMKYIEQLKVFEKQMHRAGLGKTHGARHLYAQTRYTQLTAEIQNRITGKDLDGFKAVCAGGVKPAQMDKQDRMIDREARQTLSRELGHDRIQICSIYLGG